jgi:hypothetical protein
VDWINLAEYREKWHPFVNMVMNLAVPWNTEWFLIGGRSLLASQNIHINWSGAPTRSRSHNQDPSEIIDKFIQTSQNAPFSHKEQQILVFCLFEASPPPTHAARVVLEAYLRHCLSRRTLVNAVTYTNIPSTDLIKMMIDELKKVWNINKRWIT